MAREVVIVSAVRTPVGAFLGSLASVPAVSLGAAAGRAAVERAGIRGDDVQRCVMGCVLQAGLGQAPARQAALGAGLPDGVACVTVNKVCGSGMQSLIDGARAIQLGEADVVVAGGMESMSNAPYLNAALRGGARMGHVEMKDSLIHDGLWDPYNDMHMGLCGERCATGHGFSREDQDAYARESTLRAQKAQAEGRFQAEIVPVEVPQKKGAPLRVEEDEGPKVARPDKLAALKPAFQKDGTVTAGNASSINDGAAAVVLMSAERAAREGRPVLARIVSWAGAARLPVEFTVAPADAMRLAAERAGVGFGDVDLFEINEAFAVVALANARLLGLPLEKVNVHGGAVVLGHPIGASGCRIVVTLVHALRDLDKKRGLASICIGGGEALAMVLER